MGRLPEDAAAGPAAAVLSRFRREFHACLTARRDEIFELADAVLCASGPVGLWVFHYGNWPAPSTTAIRMTAFPASVPACMVLPFTAISRSPMYW
jgi:hypothetical protein